MSVLCQQFTLIYIMAIKSRLVVLHFTRTTAIWFDIVGVPIGCKTHLYECFSNITLFHELYSYLRVHVCILDAKGRLASSTQTPCAIIIIMAGGVSSCTILISCYQWRHIKKGKFAHGCGNTSTRPSSNLTAFHHINAGEVVLGTKGCMLPMGR